MTIFTSRNKPVQQPAGPSQADAIGLAPPPLSAEHAAGIQAAAQVSRKTEGRKLAEYEAFSDARTKAREAQEAALWEKIVERQRHAIG